MLLDSTGPQPQVLVAQSCLTLCDPTNCSPPLLSMKFSRQEYWSGLSLPSPGGVFPTQWSNPGRLWLLLHWQADSWPLSHLGSPKGQLRMFLKSLEWVMRASPCLLWGNAVTGHLGSPLHGSWQHGDLLTSQGVGWGTFVSSLPRGSTLLYQDTPLHETPLCKAPPHVSR